MTVCHNSVETSLTSFQMRPERMEIHTEKLLHRLLFVSCLCKGSKEPVNRGVVGGKTVV